MQLVDLKKLYKIYNFPLISRYSLFLDRECLDLGGALSYLHILYAFAPLKAPTCFDISHILGNLTPCNLTNTLEDRISTHACKHTL
mgnify:CR=1 FL=1